VLFIVFGLIMDVELIFFIISFFYLHLVNGFKSILGDYIHKKKISFFLITLLRVLLFENLIQIIKFFF